jgi:hypothetical protein
VAGGQIETWLRVTGAGGNLHLEVMEQAASKERRFTRSALAQVQGELARALEDPDGQERTLAQASWTITGWTQ